MGFAKHSQLRSAARREFGIRDRETAERDCVDRGSQIVFYRAKPICRCVGRAVRFAKHSQLWPAARREFGIRDAETAERDCVDRGSRVVVYRAKPICRFVGRAVRFAKQSQLCSVASRMFGLRDAEMVERDCVDRGSQIVFYRAKPICRFVSRAVRFAKHSQLRSAARREFGIRDGETAERDCVDRGSQIVFYRAKPICRFVGRAGRFAKHSQLCPALRPAERDCVRRGSRVVVYRAKPICHFAGRALRCFRGWALGFRRGLGAAVFCRAKPISPGAHCCVDIANQCHLRSSCVIHSSFTALRFNIRP